MRRVVEQRPFLQRSLHAGVALLVVAALLFLAATLSTAEFKEGVGLAELLDTLLSLFTGFGAIEPLIFPPIFWRIISAAFWIVLLLAIAVLLTTREGRREIPALLKFLLQGLIFAWVILLFLRVGVYISQTIEEETTEEESTEALPFENAEAAELADQVEEIAVELPESPSAETALIVVGLLVAAAMLFLLLRWERYRQEMKAVEQQPVDALRARALQALQELRGERAALSDVIRRCYREMTRTVQEQRGVYRERSATPREFEARLLQIGLPPPPVQRLTRLFEQVRYGAAAAGEREKREAIDSLEQIIAACERLSNKKELGNGRRQ